jgi:DNA-binding MarR family transcriptional regulator
MGDGHEGGDVARRSKPTGTSRAEQAERASEVFINGWRLQGLDYPTFRLSLVAKVMDRLTLRHLAERSDYTFAEWRVLSRLASLPDGATVGQIADLAWVDRAEVSRAAAALEKRGMTARRENREDRRKPILYATEEGRKRQRPLAAERSAFHADLVADLSTDEREELDRLLAKIAQRLVQALENGTGG